MLQLQANHSYTEKVGKKLTEIWGIWGFEGI